MMPGQESLNISLSSHQSPAEYGRRQARWRRTHTYTECVTCGVTAALVRLYEQQRFLIEMNFAPFVVR